MEKKPNVAQRQVIDDLQNNLILFASAGTGKTFTVANRVANILTQEKATAKEILCLTFTIKACNEMKADILSYAGERALDTQVSTIHGFCYKLLLEEQKLAGVANGYLGICDEVDQEELLKSILSDRFYGWAAEDALAQRGIVAPIFSTCPICKRKGDDLVYCKVKNYLLDGYANVLPYKEDETDATSIFCSECASEQLLRDGKCAGCGREFAFRFADKSFEIFNRKGALRNLVSEIKHARVELKAYTGEEIADNQRAFSYIKTKKQSKYEELTSYFAKYVGRVPDEDFEDAISRFAGRLVCEYDEHLRRSNLLDFDDLIIKANALLDSEEGLTRWANRYKYIVLDEMQDTSRLEYSVLKKIFANNNVMFCGDFFQTIYGWRGSNPEEVLGAFIREFSAKAYMLSANYRATQTLAEATFGYLKNTYSDLMGKYCPQTLEIHSEEEGEPIFCYAFDNKDAEAQQIYKYLSRCERENPTDVCIIARSNKYIAELAKRLHAISLEKGDKGLRFFTVEENFQFFKKPVIKDVLAVLKLLVNPDDLVSMERLTKKFVRNVGVKTIETLRNYGEIGVSLLSFIDGQTYAFGDPYHRLIEGYQTDTIVVYDTETTGLDINKDQIVQLSAIKLNNHGEILDTLDIFIEPTVPIDEEAEKTHGFSLEYIQTHGGLTAEDGLREFSKFVKNCVLVGHNNLGYDQPLLARQFKENGLPPLEIVAEYDTLRIAKRFYPQLKDFKLSTLCERFSVVNRCAHNALGDITATGECLMKMLRESVLPTALERKNVLAKYRERFEKFYAFYEEVQSRLEGGDELAEYIVDRLLLKKKYPSHVDWLAIRDVVESLQTEREDRREFLKEYLKDASLSGSQMDVLLQKQKKIPIITVHQAKGCEFDTVILAGADDSNFPSYGAREGGNEEEEKKIFYVAITRAKRKLIMTRALHNGRYELRETPYFWKLPEEYVRANRAWKNAD